MSNTIIEQYEQKLETLLKENMELFSENMRLKYGNDNNEETKSTNSNNSQRYVSHKRLPMAVMKENKQKNLLIVAEEYQNNTPVEEIAKKIGMSVPTVRAYITELRKKNELA